MASPALQWVPEVFGRFAGSPESRTESAPVEHPTARKDAQGSPVPPGPRESRACGFVYDGVRVGRAMRAGLSRRSASSRPLPMEDVSFYVKPSSASQLRRRCDPRDAIVWRRLVLGGFAALLLTLLCFGPRAWLRQSSRRLVEMSEQQQELLEIQRHLLVRQAQLSDLRRVGRLAAKRGLSAPPPERYTWQGRNLESTDSSGELARSFARERP